MLNRFFMFLFGVVMVFSVLVSPCAWALELRVADGIITTAIEKQMPVDNIDSYSADFGKLYCFTRIVGAEVDTTVTHVWYYQDSEMARVELRVGSGDWRTYSSKRFLPQWAGEWRVIVLDGEENKIASIPFSLE